MIDISVLYTNGLFISFVSLALWFLFQNKKISPIIVLTFLIGLACYLYGLFTTPASLDAKWLSLSRDLVILGAAASFLSFFKSKKPLFLVLLLGLSFLAYQYYFSYMHTSLFMQTLEKDGAVGPINLSSYDKDGELLLELKENASLDAIQDIIQKYDLTVQPAFQMESEDLTDLDDYIIVNVPDNERMNLLYIIKAFKNNDAVEYLENNDVIQLKPIESETINRKKRRYNVNDPDISKQWGLDQMAIDELHTLLRKKNVKAQKTALIAILDTGVDANHEDLKANFKSIKKKHDTDPNAHGTHCAGIAAAVTNNGKGIASFAPDNNFVKVSSIRVLSGFGGGTQQAVINGILEAADAGADVISMSLGAPSNSSRVKAYKKAIDYATKKGAIVIAAAGNSNRDAAQYSPANTPGIIAVSAVDENLNRAVFSNYVQNVKMGIAAPGVNIYSTVPGSQYKSFNGTSMACPAVAGLIGVMKSLKPDLTAKEAYTILKKSGKDTKNKKETGQFIQPTEAIKLLLK